MHNKKPTFIQFIKEVEFLDDPEYSKRNKLDTDVGRSFKKYIDDLHSGYNWAREVEKSDLGSGHTLHHYVEGGKIHDFIVEYKGKISHQIIAVHDKVARDKNSFYISSAASSGKSPIKMHDIYYQLLKQGKTLVTGAQTVGGMKIWQQLQKKKDVNIHGWDPKTNQPVNVDLTDDPLETHTTNGNDLENRRVRDMNLVAHLK